MNRTYKRKENKLFDDDISLGYRSILSPRYPMSISSRNKTNTDLKRRYIYREYRNLVERINDVFPDMAKFLPKKYYYMVIADRLGLSVGYVSIAVTQYIKNQSVNMSTKDKTRVRREAKQI